MAQKDTKTTSKRKATATKKTTTAASKTAAKPKAVKPPKEELVVFAFRLAEAERNQIHATAGPRNATQFIRRVAIAFGNESEAEFKTVLAEARSLRG